MYNADGLRLSRTIGGATSSYVWDTAGGLPLLLQETGGGATTTYVYGPTGMLYWVDSAGSPTYRLTDGLGSTVALANASGVVTDTYTYDAFGAIRSHSGASTTEFTFTGEQNDPNGLEYLRARYYDPGTGRFLSRDPVEADLFDPRDLNLYTYAHNSPTSMTDRSGGEETFETGSGPIDASVVVVIIVCEGGVEKYVVFAAGEETGATRVIGSATVKAVGTTAYVTIHAMIPNEIRASMQVSHNAGRNTSFLRLLYDPTTLRPPGAHWRVNSFVYVLEPGQVPQQVTLYLHFPIGEIRRGTFIEPNQIDIALVCQEE